jgi:hypothetical protein
MTLEEILKADGYTDADLASLEPMLKDQRFRGTLEKQYGALQQDLKAFEEENKRWAEWHQRDGKPTLEKQLKDIADLRAERASLAERLKLAEEGGFAPKRDNVEPEPKPQGGNVEFDPKKYNLVTQEDVGSFAKLQGDAIAMANDIAGEYQHLTKGGSLYDYETVVDGRTLRGMTALRHEAMQKQQRLDQYVAEKFDFANKRKALDDEKRKAQEDAIRADERAKLMGQYGDPNARSLMPSREPFIPRERQKEGKPVMPWDVPAQDRRRERISRAMQEQARVQ